MESPIKHLSDTFAAYKTMLISSQIPPEKIPEASASMENNIAALIVSGILFFIARSVVGTGDDVLVAATLNLGLIVGVIGTIILVQTAGLIFCRDTAYGARRVDQWGTFLVFVWTFSLVTLIADNLLVTLGWVPGIHSLIAQLADGRNAVTYMISGAIYSTFALALLTFKTQRQSPGFRPGSYAIAVIVGVCINTMLLYFFVFRPFDTNPSPHQNVAEQPGV